jgi:hypothetical protein
MPVQANPNVWDSMSEDQCLCGSEELHFDLSGFSKALCLSSFSALEKSENNRKRI